MTEREHPTRQIRDYRGLIGRPPPIMERKARGGTVTVTALALAGQGTRYEVAAAWTEEDGRVVRGDQWLAPELEAAQEVCRRAHDQLEQSGRCDLQHCAMAARVRRDF